MGAVSIDVYRKEKEYRHLTLSDENVVLYLIEKRNELDISRGANRNINIYVAGDTTEFNVELIALYVSLDNLLARIEMKERELHFLELLFEGNEVGDIIKYHNFPHNSAYKIRKRIVEKVVAMNKSDWLKCLESREYIEQKQQ